MKDNIQRIIKKYLSGRFSAKTEEKVQRWLIKDENAEDKKSVSLEYWDSLEVVSNSETYSGLERVNKRIGYSRGSKKIPPYKKIVRVAAIVIPIFILVGGYLYYQSTRNNLIEINVAYGENKHLFLPDSSEIWLNAGTTIKYPKEFKGDKRTIYLNGEAYFSVERNEKKPFIVQTEIVSVKVLGTKFNLKAYSDDEKVTTTLTNGKVEVNTNNEFHILKPNEQLTFDRNTYIINIVEVSSNETDSWLSGQLVFNNSSLKDIVQVLERSFNISITNRTEIPESKLYTVKFLRNESPEEILNILQEIVGFSYQKDENGIVLTKKL